MTILPTALRRHIDLSVGCPPGRDWKRRPGRPRARLIDQVRFLGLEHLTSGTLEECRTTWPWCWSDATAIRDHDDDDQAEMWHGGA